MFKIIICDSEKENIEKIFAVVNSIVKNTSEGRNINIFSASPKTMINYKIKDNYTYLVFLDIIYEDVSGIEIAKKLRSQYKDVFIIFITRHIELMYMVVNQNIMPSGFLAKPINQNEVKMLLLNIFDYSKAENKTEISTLTVRTGSAIYKIRYDEIIFIEALNRKIYIYTDSQRISFNGSLYSLEEELGENFLRCHKSYIVNKNKIKNVHIGNMYIEMTNGSKVLMSKAHKKAVKTAISEV